MLAYGVRLGIGTAGALLAAVGLTQAVVLCAAAATIAGAIVGLLFRGAATAWREERDAAVDKAERLERKVSDQDTKIATLEQQVAELLSRTNYDEYALRSAREHREIIEALAEVKDGLGRTTMVLELLFKQVFPTAIVTPDMEAPQ